MRPSKADPTTTSPKFHGASVSLSLIFTLLLLPLGCGTPLADDGTSSDDEGSTTGEPDQWDEFVEPLAGTRLRPLVRTAEDGTRIQIGWHDTLLDTPCSFETTPNAGLRCVPTTVGNDVWLYADANCTEPVLQDIWIPEGTTVVRERGDSCFDHTYYEVGEPVTEIYYAANGPCEFFSNDPAHRVSVLAHEQLVSATVTPLEGKSRIVPLLLQADDGSQQIVGAWDRTHEEEVAAGPDAGEQLRWFGRWQPRVSTFYYADANCTERVALAECVPDSEQPTTARETEADVCGALLGRHELLEEVGQRYTKNANDECVADSWSSGAVRQWRVGAALDDSAFAQSSAVDRGGDRLRHDIYTSPEGEPIVPSAHLYDRELTEMECRWRDPLTYSAEPSTSTTFNCIPTDGAGLSSRYQDGACTQRTASRWVSEESCPGPALYAYAEGMATTITGPAAGEGSFGLDDQDVCGPLAPSVPSDGGDGVDEYYLVEGTLTEVAHAVDVIE